MKEIILVKSGEIVLKGMNRYNFENVLIKNMGRRIKDLGRFQITKSQSAIFVENLDDKADMSLVLERLKTVFGIAALTPACMVEKDFDTICGATKEYLKDILENTRTFKVTAKRSDKSFAMNSPEICRELGGVLLDAFPHLQVDVQNPQVTVTVEVREKGAYIHVDQLLGAGGIPVSTGGKATLLLSGGIDSPVAGYMMAKRGLEIVCVHFASPPYTSERAKEKVIMLAKKMVPYTGRMKLYIVPFTEMQEVLRDRCKEDLFTIAMRRYMMKIAEAISKNEGSNGLVTGESVGQVASQTLQAIACTDIATEMPVLRPLIGMDKEEIVRIARKIDTFETSILPYEDCCTVFTPKHPKTKPSLAEILANEEEMGIPEEIVNKCIEEAELININLEL